MLNQSFICCYKIYMAVTLKGVHAVLIFVWLPTSAYNRHISKPDNCNYKLSKNITFASGNHSGF